MREIKFRAKDAYGEWCDVETVSKPVDGRGSHNFKGWMKNSGYILRKVKGHPFANGRGYVPEHRLVMEESLGRFLLTDEVVHHKDGDRENNELGNLELVINQSSHASIEDRGKRNPNGQFIAKDPKFQEKKFRLYDSDRGVTKIYTLSKLINTTYRRGCFEYRGEWTGLHDKNGVEIYEGDVLYRNFGPQASTGEIYEETTVVEYGHSSCSCGSFTFPWLGIDVYTHPEEMEVIGNIYENKDLLTKNK